MAGVVDALSFERTPQGRRYINYRDLGVQQLGSIYERLLEQEIIREGDEFTVRPDIFARKDSGSYYTPDDLVGLILAETLEPLAQARLDAFAAEASEPASSRLPEDRRLGRLKRLDPAEKLLELKICDPATRTLPRLDQRDGRRQTRCGNQAVSRIASWNNADGCPLAPTLFGLGACDFRADAAVGEFHHGPARFAVFSGDSTGSCAKSRGVIPPTNTPHFA